MRIIVLTAVVCLSGCGRSDLTARIIAPSAESPSISATALPAEAHPLKSLKALVLSKQHIHDASRMYSPNGNSWSFNSNGTFTVGALTGRRSWTASGSWKELSEGRLSLTGTQENAFSPDSGTQPYSRVLGGYRIVHKSEDGISVRFDQLWGVEQEN